MKPAITSGAEYSAAAFIDTTQYAKEGNGVLQINFFNQGTNSTAVIRVGTVDIELPPGNLKQGSNLSISAPAGFFDTTKYQIFFKNAGIGGTQRNALKVVFMLCKIKHHG